MNTGTRRFILRLAVGLLAFLLGVAAVWALAGLNPFRKSSGETQYRKKRCGHYYHSQVVPNEDYDRFDDLSEVEPTYLVGPRGCKMKKFELDAPPPPPPTSLVR